MGLESLPVSNEMLTKAYRKRAKELHPDRLRENDKNDKNENDSRMIRWKIGSLIRPTVEDLRSPSGSLNSLFDERPGASLPAHSPGALGFAALSAFGLWRSGFWSSQGDRHGDTPCVGTGVVRPFATPPVVAGLGDCK